MAKAGENDGSGGKKRREKPRRNLKKSKRREPPMRIRIRVEKPFCPRCLGAAICRTGTKPRIREGLIIRHMRCAVCRLPFMAYIEIRGPKTLPERESFTGTLPDFDL